MRRRVEHLGLVLAPTFRSRAYVQYLQKAGLVPGVVLTLPGAEWPWDGPKDVRVPLGDGIEPFDFRPAEPATTTAREAGWPVVALPDADINASVTIDHLKTVDAEVLVYSGFSKVLLKQQTLESGKRFLHIHGGYLPEYRGATGFYFGLLEHGKLGVTAIWLDAGVDTGAVLSRRWYQPSPQLDIDYIQDPVTRAHLLSQVVSERLQKGSYPALVDAGASRLHFVIHPVLKAIALERARNGRGHDV